MSRSRFEIVHTGPYKFHARYVTANNETVWTTESYKRRLSALEAIALIWNEAEGDTEVRDVDERTP